jgi:tRNA(Ile)-lysidine synthetase-like protein
MTVRREHDCLVFYHGVDPARRSEAMAHPLSLPGSSHLLGYVVNAREFSRETEDHASWRARSDGSLESGGELTSAVAYFARDRVTPPFIVRPAAPGDRMRPFGLGGHRKKLSDIFIDTKIPYRLRGAILVVEDQREIVWVAGVTTSEATRVTTDTRDVVELQMTIE